MNSHFVLQIDGIVMHTQSATHQKFAKLRVILT